MPGLIPTLNKRGFMLAELDPFSEAFATQAGKGNGWALDMGCAYGIASLAALEHGAAVHAVDMDAGHIEILVNEAGPAVRDRLRTSVAALPNVDFPRQAFATILCSRMLHFLSPEDAQLSVRKLSLWLEPGGRLFLTADTPYTPMWARRAPIYEANKAGGDPWPGYIEDFRAFIPPHVDPAGHPEFLNPLDPDILARLCRGNGLIVERCEFFRSPGREDKAEGKAHAGCIATKPATDGGADHVR